MNFKEIHVPVLLKEVLYYLDLKKGDVIFDGTLGGAGHTVEIIKAIAPTGKVIGVDLHSQTLSTASTRLEKFSKNNVILVNDNFANISDILEGLNIKSIDGILLDLGLSSFLIEKSKRGFSYVRDEELDMRYGNGNLKAFDVVNEYTEDKLIDILRRYGEERWAKSIARNITIRRETGDIKSTGELVKIIKDSIPKNYKYSRKGNPAKRVFQAIRMEVNKELDSLRTAISNGFKMLGSKGRMVIISYHSLEDRLVKNSFLEFEGICTCPPGLPVCTCGREKKAEIITRRAVKPSREEIELNPRSRNARLRALEKL